MPPLGSNLFRIVVFYFLCASTLLAGSLEKTPVASGYGGAVATISAKASKAALGILNEGGNAVDAAVAAAAALGVTDPFSCGIGGGGFMMIYLAKDKRIISIDHRETAPLGSLPNMFIEKEQPIAFKDAIASGLSIGVPGTVRGWHEALSRYGTRTFKQVLRPAIDIATQGFVIDENFHRINKANEKKFAKFTSTSELYLKNGQALPLGTLFKNHNMARAYNDIAQFGVRYFYEGAIAKAMVKAVQDPPTAKGIFVRPGTMTMADLANYETRLRLPIHSKYRGFDVYGMNLPSSGGIAIAEALNILEGYPLSHMPRSQVEHLFLETSRLIFADRNAYLADPEFIEVPIVGLLSKDYAAKRREFIDLNAASRKKALPGEPYLFQESSSDPCNKKRAEMKPAIFAEESAHTTHLTVSDKDGNIVAYTFTIEDWGGSGIVVPGYGFILNNELTDFNFKSPPANLPAPLKRPRSSMSPTMIFKDGLPVLALGSPGGNTIITTVLQTLINYFDLGMKLEDALAAPRMSQRNEDTTLVEPSLKDTAQEKSLLKLGHSWSPERREIGAANAILFEKNGLVTAVSERERHGIGSALVQSKSPLKRTIQNN